MIMGMKERIIKCIKAVKGDYFTEENKLISDGLIDSFEMLQLISMIEEEFSIKVDIESVVPGDFNSVSEIERIIKNNTNNYSE